MRKELVLSGFGGQGLMLLGKILARAATEEKKHTTWFPSYGAEMRGGTAHCSVIISDSAIYSPYVESPDIAVLFNQPSLDKFEKRVTPKGILILNSDLIERHSNRSDIQIVSMPLNQIAITCGSIKVANVVALGALLELTGSFLKEKTIISIMKETFKKENVLEYNLNALDKGGRFVTP